MIAIRHATPTAGDALAFSELADMATRQLLGAVLGPRGLAMMETLFRHDQNNYSHRHVRFVTVDGRIAGMMCGLSDASWRENASRTIGLQLRHLAWHLPQVLVHSWPLRHVIEFVNRSHAGQFYVPYIAVHPEFRRRGLARRLMTEAEALARLEGCSILALCADPDDLRALALYRSCGMREVARSPAGIFRGREETLVRLEKALT